MLMLKASTKFIQSFQHQQPQPANTTNNNDSANNIYAIIIATTIKPNAKATRTPVRTRLSQIKQTTQLQNIENRSKRSMEARVSLPISNTIGTAQRLIITKPREGERKPKSTTCNPRDCDEQPSKGRVQLQQKQCI
jgi:hypothetical protein